MHLIGVTTKHHKIFKWCLSWHPSIMRVFVCRMPFSKTWVTTMTVQSLSTGRPTESAGKDISTVALSIFILLFCGANTHLNKY